MTDVAPRFEFRKEKRLILVKKIAFFKNARRFAIIPGRIIDYRLRQTEIQAVASFPVLFRDRLKRVILHAFWIGKSFENLFDYFGA